MAGVSRKADRDRSMEFKGFLKDLNDWDYLFDDEDRKLKAARSMDKGKGSPMKVPSVEVENKGNASSGLYSKGYSRVAQMPSSLLSDETLPDAATEKDLGNEYFKQKKYLEAIDCYSKSIALSPTSVAFANRAMAYLKVKKFEEAESDCTEALNLDDRYVKAYSRRATARKELGKLKASMEDSDFAIRLEPNNQELRKQYTETKVLLEKELAKKNSGPPKSYGQGTQKVENSDMLTKGVKGVHSISSNPQKDTNGKAIGKPLIAVNDTYSNHMSTGVKTRDQTLYSTHHSAASISNCSSVKVVDRSKHVNASIRDLASRAASRVMATAVKDIPVPKSAYEFEVSWRALSANSEKQAHLLKAIPPASLPQIFKNALSSSILIDIIKCTATFFKEDSELALSILENLVKVPRYDMLLMCLSAADHSELRRLWEEVFLLEVPFELVERLNSLQPKYCYGKW
ncbi:RNA polymerase II-associated protein 3 [Iris pallida]|uniref:RNA polymerase II-associated protein 3 n=1 Tax=Iris pallida TaxID=29817 RepID=A0AAX6DR33_IRIPA|nr:RNA polymerase II-associated protein 3 [Iris pallida]